MKVQPEKRGSLIVLEKKSSSSIKEKFSRKSFNKYSSFPITYENPEKEEDENIVLVKKQTSGMKRSTLNSIIRKPSQSKRSSETVKRNTIIFNYNDMNMSEDSSKDSPDKFSGLELKKISEEITDIRESQEYINAHLTKIDLKKPSTASIETDDSNTSQILIVDDISYCRMQLDNMLKKIRKEKNLNFEIIQEDDGLGTINRVIKDMTENLNKIKLIISDENMNYINGSQSFSTLSILEHKGAIKKIKKAILTAIEDDGTLNYLKSSANADYVLKKPVPKSTLADIVTACLNN